jgi:hypothetical protein
MLTLRNEPAPAASGPDTFNLMEPVVAARYAVLPARAPTLLGIRRDRTTQRCDCKQKTPDVASWNS